MAPHSSTLAWKIPWMEEPGRLQSIGMLDMTEWLHFHFSLSCIGEGNGNPLQCSCLENPRDGGAWWAALYGVAQSQTRLKWLSSSMAAFMIQQLSWVAATETTQPTKFEIFTICHLTESLLVPDVADPAAESDLTLRFQYVTRFVEIHAT